MYPRVKSTSITSLADIQMGTNLTNDYLIVCSSRPVLDQVISDLELGENYRALKSKVKVSNPSNTRFLDITVTDPHPDRAKAIADEIAEVSSRFIAEKMDQDPPSIIQYGYADEEKVSPNTKRNTLIGGLAGFVLSAGLFVVIYLFNNTVDTPEDVETKLGLKLIQAASDLIDLAHEAVDLYLGGNIARSGFVDLIHSGRERLRNSGSEEGYKENDHCESNDSEDNHESDGA